MMKIIQFQNRIQAFRWDGLASHGHSYSHASILPFPWINPWAICESSTTRTKTVLDWVKKLELFCLYCFECCKHGIILTNQFIGWTVLSGATQIAKYNPQSECCKHDTTVSSQFIGWGRAGRSQEESKRQVTECHRHGPNF